jgi:FdhE protein
MDADAWLKKHPYLQPIARLTAQIDSAADVVVARASIPSWDEYASDYAEGVPLLLSFDAPVDLEPAGESIARLVEKLAGESTADKLNADLRTLDAELRRDRDLEKRLPGWLLGDTGVAPPSPGLLRFVGWTAMRRYLAPLFTAFDRWRVEDRWLRNFCPSCGSHPAMAQLIGIDPGRMRFLVCGHCRTRWRYKRTSCPFCAHDSQQVTILAVEGEAHLRIDHCESCRGYLKTYVGEGEERLYLADWTSLHLDLIAQERGLERVAASLYELDPRA